MIHCQLVTKFVKKLFNIIKIYLSFYLTFDIYSINIVAQLSINYVKLKLLKK